MVPPDSVVSSKVEVILTSETHKPWSKRPLSGLSLALLLSVWPLTAVAQETPTSRTVVHGELPVDPDYWRFLRWYLSHSVLDVYVNGENPEHLARVLHEVAALKERRVLLRDIVVISGTNFSYLDANTRKRVQESKAFTSEGRDTLRSRGMDPGLAVLADKIDLSEGVAVSDVSARIEALGVSQSPVWVLTYQGKEYVFEGVTSMKKFFDRSGAFRGAEQ